MVTFGSRPFSTISDRRGRGRTANVRDKDKNREADTSSRALIEKSQGNKEQTEERMTGGKTNSYHLLPRLSSLRVSEHIRKVHGQTETKERLQP
jgi:hypothetical protein